MKFGELHIDRPSIARSANYDLYVPIRPVGHLHAGDDELGFWLHALARDIRTLNWTLIQIHNLWIKHIDE